MTMRRAGPARAQQGRSGCLGALVGLAVGVALSYWVYLWTGAASSVIILGLLGAYVGGQIAQRLAARRPRTRRRRG